MKKKPSKKEIRKIIEKIIEEAYQEREEKYNIEKCKMQEAETELVNSLDDGQRVLYDEFHQRREAFYQAAKNFFNI